MIIDDNFLNKETVEAVEELLLDSEMTWHLHSLLSKTEVSFDNVEPYDGFQFNHVFYQQFMPSSPYLYNVLPIFLAFCNKHGIEVKALLRAKANLTFPDRGAESSAPHVDHYFPHKVFLYYVNDSDGYTILYKQKFEEVSERVHLDEMTRVAPKAGRAVCFDGLNYHTPTVPEQSAYRAVINITFI